MWLIYFFAVILQPASGLDFEAFKAKVQPLLTEKRPGHARCITCHSTGTAFRLIRLPQGRDAYTEEESRKNFEAASRMVLAEFHPGGKHWESQDDPEWKALAAWVSAGK